MWQSLVYWLKELLFAGRELQQTRAEMKEMRQQMDALNDVMQDVLHGFERLRENETHEREKMALRLENEMLKFERRLPRPRHDEELR